MHRLAVFFTTTGLICFAASAVVYRSGRAEVAAARSSAESLAMAQRRLADEIGRRSARIGEQLVTVSAEISDLRSKLATASLKPLSVLDMATLRTEILRHDPEYIRHWQRQQRRYIQKRYELFFAESRLAPDQLERLKQFMVERIESSRDARQLALRAGLDQLGEMKAVQRASKEVDQDIRQLLGEAGFKALRDFEGAAVQQPRVDSLRFRLADLGLPTLDAAQTKALTEAYREARNDRRLSLASMDERIRARVAPVLTAEQLDALTQLQASETASLEVYSRLTRDITR